MAVEITDHDAASLRIVRDDLRVGLRGVVIQRGADPDELVVQVVTLDDVAVESRDEPFTAVAWEVDFDMLRLDDLGMSRSGGGDVVVRTTGTLTGITMRDERTGQLYRSIDWLSTLQGAGVITGARPQRRVDGFDLDDEVAFDAAPESVS